MQRPRSSTRSRGNWIFYPLALATLFLSSGCAPGTAATLSGVGCEDPSCNEVKPETRRVLGCIGEGCDESPPPGAAKQVPQADTDEVRPVADSAAPKAEADADGSSPWKIKVYYERRPDR